MGGVRCNPLDDSLVLNGVSVLFTCIERPAGLSMFLLIWVVS